MTRYIGVRGHGLMAPTTWILGQGHIFLNTAGDIHVLPKVLRAADRHEAEPEKEEMEEMFRRRQMSRLFVS